MRETSASDGVKGRVGSFDYRAKKDKDFLIERHDEEKKENILRDKVSVGLIEIGRVRYFSFLNILSRVHEYSNKER